MNDTKEMILDRLYNSSGVHGPGISTLPALLPVDDVLKAINIDEYFFKEKLTKGQMSKPPSEVIGELLSGTNYGDHGDPHGAFLVKLVAIREQFKEDEENAARRSQGIPDNLVSIRRPRK